MNDMVGLSGRSIVYGPGTAQPVPYESEKSGEIDGKPSDNRIREVIDLFVGPAACSTAGAFSGLSSEFRKIRKEFSPSYEAIQSNEALTVNQKASLSTQLYVAAALTLPASFIMGGAVGYFIGVGDVKELGLRNAVKEANEKGVEASLYLDEAMGMESVMKSIR